MRKNTKRVKGGGGETLFNKSRAYQLRKNKKQEFRTKRMQRHSFPTLSGHISLVMSLPNFVLDVDFFVQQTSTEIKLYY